MRNDLIVDLAECTEFRQALRAKAPRIVHVTTVLLILLLGTALTWMALTKADLIVRATGRVRPLSSPKDALDDFSGEISCEIGGRVVELNVNEGDEVRRGDVLLRLDATRVENQIAELNRTIQTAEEELENLGHLKRSLTLHFESARRKAEAELTEAEEELNSAREQQAVEVRLAGLQLTEAEDMEQRTRKLVAQRAVAQVELVDAVTRAAEARERLRQAEFPLHQGRLDVLRQALDVVQREHEVKTGELEIKRRAKLGEVEVARLQLANLELDRNRAVVRAPADGIVTTVKAKAGNVVEPGKLGITLARQVGFQFEVTVPSAEVAHLRTGLPSRIKLDAYDYQKYGTLQGIVKTIAPDSEVIEGPEGAQVAVYRVEIKVSQDTVGRGEHNGQVRLGMTGQAEIVTDRENILVLLLRRIRQSVSLFTL